MTERNSIFNSYSDPIPPVRFDIQRIPVQQNGHSLIYFHDSLGYATPNFALPAETGAILSLIDGSRSVEDILGFSSGEVNKEHVLGYVRFLDENGLLDSEYFANQAELIETEYEQSKVHLSNTAGGSYPKDPDALIEYLDEAFSDHELHEPQSAAKALYAPHIDPRVGMNSYVKAFSTVRDMKPKRVVILATSHYSGWYGELYREHPFILSQKKFAMPNGTVEPDTRAIQELLSRVGEETGISLNDRAHRIEHSIELHLLFLNHLWNHDFRIVPILVGGFDELLYMPDSYRAGQLEQFSTVLSESFADDPDTFFLISGDLCHVGKKFGDPEPASELMDVIRNFDGEFLKAGAEGDAASLLTLIKSKLDAHRVCGFSPLYTFLKAFPELKGEQLTYDIWDETERDSAVSFGSILYQ